MRAEQALGQRWAAFQPTKTLLVWSCAACTIGAIVIGFTYGGWVTGRTARSMAQDAATVSRDQLVAAICVDRFKAGEDAATKLAALKGMQSWDRGSFIEKGGWAAMPDRSAPTNTSTRLCADQLVAL